MRTLHEAAPLALARGSASPFRHVPTRPVETPSRCVPARVVRVSGQGARAAGRVLSGAALAVLLGCSAMPIAPGSARADDADATGADPETRARAFDGDLMYELMIAELAGRRGQLEIATQGYLAAATRSDDPRVADRAARLAMFGRRWADAASAARRWIELDGEARDAHEVLAHSLLLQGDDAGAAAEYVTLVGMVPASDGAGVDESAAGGVDDAPPMTRAEVLRGLFATLREEDPARAGTVMKALAEAYPDEAEAHLGVARLALASNDREAALDAVERALARNPRSADAQLIRARVLLVSGRADDAFDGLDAAIDVDAENVPLRLGRARLLAETGRTDDALAEFERLHELAPTDGDVLLTIGLLALEADRVEPARRYLESLLASGAHADQANFYLARIDDGTGAHATAIERYEAVGHGPLYADARIRAAELLAVGGSLEAGRERLGSLAAEIPDPALARRLLVAESRMLQQAGDPAEAVRVLSDGLERFPEDSDLLYARALAADGAGDPDTLESDLARLIAKEPDNAHALNALGYHLVDAGRRLDEAATYLEKAAALEPDDAAILDSLGWLRYRQGELAEAEELLRRALALYPDGEIAAHLGEVLWMRGEREAAREIWNAALVESPEHEVLQRVVKKFAAE